SPSGNAAGVYKVYYNSVYLNGVWASTGANAQSAPFFSSQEIGAGGLDLRNNILINNSDLTLSGSSARAMAFLYSTSSHDLSGISLNSNNNILYSGRQKTGTGTITSSGAAITGTGTSFTTQLFVGAMLYLGNPASSGGVVN